MNYIDSWFHFYDTTESFEQHRDKGLINPNSICFIKESGQVYTQNSFFGICRERYERLEQLAKELDNRFGETLAEIEQFERDINSDFNEFKELVGAPDGIAPLDRDSKIPAAYLPSYVDDVLEYATRAAFPVTGETGKIYVSLDDNLTYRWSGSTYIEISKSLGLGETSSTAYPGSKGKKNADDIAAHKIDYSNPHRVTKVQVGLGNVDNTSDLDKPVSNAAKTEFDSIKTRMNDLEGNVSISYEALREYFDAFASRVGEAMDTKVDKVEGKGLSTNDFSDELKSKLTKTISIYNSKDLEVENSSLKLKLGDIIYYEANEYLPYPAYTYVADITSENEVRFGNILTDETLGVYLEGFGEFLNTKVDKVEGKGLSTNDFTDEYKGILDNPWGETIN